jgi:hypothetical protein
MSNLQCIYGRRPRPRQPGSPHLCRPAWLEHLCPIWLGLIEQPRSFRVFREYEIPARRVVGHDAENVPCFQSYDYRLVDLRSDDDEDYYLAITYSESVDAWRLRDGRWLVHRRVEPLGDEDAEICSVSIDDRMPG